MNDTVLTELSKGVATVTLNRPQALNALSDDMIEALLDIMPRLEADPAVRCVVLQGAGDHFMAGGDVKGFHRRLDEAPETLRRHFEAKIHRLHPVVVTMRRMPKPIVAAVQGACAGFGLSFMLAADLALAAEDAYFTLAYCRIGTSPDGGSSYHLPRIVGLRKAMEIALLGDRFDAATAERLGLVNRVVPAAELADETAALARRLAEGPAQALANTKRLLGRSLDSGLEAQLQAEAESFAECAATPDFAEGVTAFVEKRAAKFGER